MCTCTEEGSIRLSDGHSSASGRVEMFLGGVWASVCDDGYDYYAAEVTCRQLGLHGGWPLKESYFGISHDAPIMLDGVECQGAETRLMSCAHDDVGRHDCQ